MCTVSKVQFTVNGPDGEVEITDALQFPCPGCGKDCSVSFEKCAVLHPMPMCKLYERTSPDEFLRLAHRKMKERGPS